MVNDFLKGLPKIVLHDHLDGALRPATIVELAAEQGYGGLPTTNVAELAEWFDQGMPGNSLETYLQTFAHTVALLQNEEAIRRVTREWVEDVAAEGVVYGEVRVAPELLTNGGLSMDRVVDVIVDELDGSGAANGVVARLICCAMRTEDNSRAVARIVADRVGSSVVAFDLAGSERGGPALRHKEAIDLVHAAGGKVTLHAGEGDGVASIRQAAVERTPTRARGAHHRGHRLFGSGPAIRRGRPIRPRAGDPPRNLSDVERAHRDLWVARRPSDHGASGSWIRRHGEP